MTLDEWLNSQGPGSAAALARALGCSRPYITDLRNNRRKPSPAMGQLIEAATDGAVKADAWGAP